MIYPIGIQDFTDIRNKGFVYVDKTAHIHRLATTGKCYFLSRPRRFGKSLLISTMEAYFSGRKELFKGLAIEKLEQDWITYPVLHLDLNTGKYETVDELPRILDRELTKWETQYGTTANALTPHDRFLAIIERAYNQTGQQVVILIDEYDKPMLQAIGNDELQAAYRSILKAFYSVLKSQDKYIRFAFITGVTKFGKVSVFNDLNNLKDISMLKSSNDICGITEAEIYTYFQESIKELAEANEMTAEEAADKLKRLYDGYHFCNTDIGIYNPFSLLSTLDSLEYHDYWFHTGTPTFLIELLKNSSYPLERLQKEQVDSELLNTVDSMTQNPIPVIYQSGYLTIKGYDKEFGLYSLGFPNEEVERAFVKSLMPFYAPSHLSGSLFNVGLFVEDVRKGNPEQFIERLQTFFNDGDYQVAGNMELYFQNCMWVIFKLMGFYTEIERHTSRGRIDLTLKTKDYIYIIEIKLDGSAEEAIQQIDDKGYALPYAMDTRKLFKLGITFSSQTKTIESYLIR